MRRLKAMMYHRSEIAMLLLGCATPAGHAALATQTSPAPTRVTFEVSAYPDFLFYLLNRSTGRWPEISDSVPLGSIAPFDRLTAFPEEVAQASPPVSSYAGLLAAAATRSDSAAMRIILTAGESHYTRFAQFWARYIAPTERVKVAEWVGAHGHNWLEAPRAAELMTLVRARGGTEYDPVEALCLLMQVKLSQAFGLTEPGLRISPHLPPSPRRDILAALEDGWDQYTQQPTSNLIDYLIDRGIAALPH